MSFTTMVEGAQVRSFGERIADLAADDPDGVGLVFVPAEGPERAVSWGELDVASSAIAELIEERGVGRDSIVVLSLGGGPLLSETAIAAWRLGATVLPCNPAAPAEELAVLLETAALFRRPFTVGNGANGRPDFRLDELERAVAEWGGGSKPARATPDPYVALASGGTTGRTKLIVNDGEAAVTMLDGRPQVSPYWAALGFRAGLTQLVCLPLHHGGGFSWTHVGLVYGNRVVLHERFDAERVLDSIERHRVQQSVVVPTVLLRLLESPRIDRCDLSSLETLVHAGEFCPEWLKRRWLELVPPHVLTEGYGATEDYGATVIRGDEWLARPGSVGRPVDCELQIVDDDGRVLPAGEVGEISMRPAGARTVQFRYVGADYHRLGADGFASVGDLGRVDSDGYLYLVDRRVDMFITGGVNVFPAEVEAVVSSHPAVREAVVVGVTDVRWGKRIHAVVVPIDPASPPSDAELERHCRARLAPPKVPKTFSLASEIPRSSVGKVRRREILERLERPAS